MYILFIIADDAFTTDPPIEPFALHLETICDLRSLIPLRLLVALFLLDPRSDSSPGHGGHSASAVRDYRQRPWRICSCCRLYVAGVDAGYCCCASVHSMVPLACDPSRRYPTRGFYGMVSNISQRPENLLTSSLATQLSGVIQSVLVQLAISNGLGRKLSAMKDHQLPRFLKVGIFPLQPIIVLLR